MAGCCTSDLRPPGMPMLPLSGLAASSMLTGCGGGGDDSKPTPTFVSAAFGSMAAPTTTANMATAYVASTLTVTLSDGSTHTSNLAYEPFFLTGTQVSNGAGGQILAGGYYDINNQPILDTTCTTSQQFFSDSPDGTSLLTVPNAKVTGVSGNTVFAVVQFEYTTWAQDGTTDMYGKLPSPIAVLTLDQNPSTGKLSLVKYHNVDTSGVHGLWITCGASLSPWGTHLSSEEYEPDAWSLPSYWSAFQTNLADSTVKPYHYGHLPEVTVKADGTASIAKHYCMGRISHELVQVMPDNRTVLMGDDATNSALFMFVADTEKDLSAGTLYVGQLQGDFNTALLAGTSSVGWKWIKLGHATSDYVEALADTLSKEDIMDVKFVDPTIADPNATDYTKIYVSGKANWVKLVTGMEKAAAFLETHRYAYLKGGSMGFTKMEGTTVNIKDKIAYSALQNMQDSMVTNNTAKGWNAASRIGLDAALKAGGVLAHTLAGSQVDKDGNTINSEWVPVSTKVLLTGEDITADSLGNTANPEKIGNPDNLKFSEKLRTLFIGEDSGQHTNNFLWAYNVDTKQLSRILSVPAGGESTGLHAVDEINGWTYIMSNFQHAGDSSYVKNNAALNTAINTNYNNKFSAAVGYLTASSTSIKLRA
ncbi:PhoX family phosphatase [Aquabacterium sp.]|uniref:PhoX family protein n=1 Tax=Aquabacterium sp. TaxID=1872578 RepID=UPI0035B117A4